MDSFKVSIIGCGNVGATIAYALLLDGTPSELALIDANPQKAQGLMLDLEHSLPFTPYVRLEASEKIEAVKKSDLIIITAGKRSAAGESRLDLAQANKKIFSELIPSICAAAPDALQLIITNPLDVLTHQALKLSKLPAGRVFGSGTILDTARFQFHISQRLHIHPRSIDAYILGEHGDSSFPVFSSANVMGRSIFDFPGFSKKDAEKCYEETRTAAYRIINDLGFTCYSIATSVRSIVKAIVHNTNEVFMLSTLLHNYYGHSDVCLSIPSVLGRNGISKTIEIPLDQDEQKRLAKSVEVVKALL